VILALAVAVMLSQSALHYAAINTIVSIVAGVIIMTTQLLSLGLKRIRQPRVIAEVIGGIFLGRSFELHVKCILAH
jgi:Kef-type K+ transport system membrane component KefB